MTVKTSVPPPQWTERGFIVPAAADVLAGVQADINAAFGGNLNPSLDTPQGQLASSEAAVIDNANATFLRYTQEVDPAFASGRMQDAIARIYFIERDPARPTTVIAQCIGLPGVVIPTGAIAVAADGNQYLSTHEATIPVSGTVDMSFSCAVPGPIPCPAGSLNRIFQAIPGWDAIINADDGVLGNNTETRAAFEERRRQSVALNSLGGLPSVRGAVLNAPGVIDVYVTENDTNDVKTIGGVSLYPNSIYVAVVGGEAQDVARAIWSRKAPGCSYNGNTTVIIADQSEGYSPPYPVYQVSFQTPEPLSIRFSVNIVGSTLVPSDALSQIRDAIIAAFAGEDGGPRARIGSRILASRFYTPVATLGSWAQIVSIEIGTEPEPPTLFEVVAQIDQVPVVSADDITLILS